MNRLLIADLKRMWRQGLAIPLLLACGIALFVMSNSSVRSVENTRNRYYQQYRFADVFAGLVRAPQSLGNRIAEIPGVQRAQTRIVRDVLLDIDDMVEPASCRLVSIETDDPSPMNAVYLTRGSFPRDPDRSEVILSELFAEAHQLLPGDTIDCIMGGRKQTLRIVGVGLSPEYVYVVQPGLMLTDNRRYGVAWMPRRQMEAAFNMEGAFNYVSIQLQPHANTEEVIARLDRLTKPFGGTGAYAREDQESHLRVADEMSQMKTMAFVMPTIFLAVSGFLFNIVFTRLINQQTEQIATLRAFGYRPSEVGWHYVKMVLLLVGIGSAIGCLAGMRMSWWLTDAYIRFFRFPTIDYEFATRYAVIAILSAAAAAIAGTFAAIRKAVSLQPAVAMRPPAPRDYHGLWAERTGLSRWLSPVARMVVRRLETNRLSTTLSVLGMALGVAIVVLGSFFEDTIDYVVSFQFDKSQRQDVNLTFVETLSPSAVHDMQHLPGVSQVQPYRSAPVKLRHGRRTERLALMGLDEVPQLYRILDDQEKQVTFPVREGLTLSEKLAETLDVRTGDRVTVEVLDRRQFVKEMLVAKVFPNFSGPAAYLNRQQLHQLLQEGEQYSGAFLSVDPARLDQLYEEVKQTPTIAGVTDQSAARAAFDEAISESTSIMRVVYAVFSIGIALGVMYNCAIIILAERARDLATLRVMGFRRREVSMVLLSELAVITLLSLPIGLPIGYAFAYLTTVALDTDTQRFPLVIQPSTYAYATVIIVAGASLSALYVRRMLNSLDLVSVLKVKE
ncbi:FtsX-like permease family protein [Roseiconus nitratireducens]|uniref:FtsX-like permease family protein n=1 Tax=Roseiconus nitratireducens TaxID=2605748 RepID=A0A5M6DLS2_9BACT|nr:FtsX-like permease family protein [Roseiconus nitratireducens]KAA5547080.1 FtsX-like permease family protein [Roseiconus nitratireducens]